MIEEYFRIAYRSITERKVRSFLTVLGIFLGILTIFVLLSLSIGLRGFVTEQFELLGSDKFFIQPKGQAGAPGTGGAVELTTDDVAVVERVSGVEIVSYMAIGNTKISYKEEDRYYMTIGFPIDDPKKIDMLFVGFGTQDGRMLKKTDRRKILMGYNYGYKNLFSKGIKPGDIVELNEVPFEVIGIVEAIGNPGDDQQVYIGIEDFKEVFDSGDRVDYMMIQIKEGEDMTEVYDRVERKLMNFRDVDEKTSDFSVLTPEGIMDIFGAVLNRITGFLVLIGLISAIVGGIGIANTMYTSVLERRKEIGTMKAVGARNSDILSIFVIEAGILGLIGGLLGVIIGALIAKGIEYALTIELGVNLLRASLHPFLILGCLAFGFIVGIFSGLLPSYQASKLKPVDALRYE